MLQRAVPYPVGARGDAETRQRGRHRARPTSPRRIDDARVVTSRAFAATIAHAPYAGDDYTMESIVRLKRPPPKTSVERAAPLRLLTSYSSVVEALRKELDTTQAGDVVRFSVYVFESGKSSDAVIAAMRRAVKRGVTIRCEIDGSPVSKFTRWCEQSTTLTDELQALQRELGRERFSFKPVKQASHAKFMIVQRKRGGGMPSIIFGGVNIGDRFSHWRDFAIRAEGQAVVDALRATMRRSSSTVASDTADIVFASNVPTGFCPMAWTFPRYFRFPGRFDIQRAMTDLLEDERYTRYYVAMAYIDSMGVDLLASALRRDNTTLTLVVPRTPNVYHDANRKALGRLIKANDGREDNLKILLLDDMLHAKAFHAESADDSIPAVGMIGSCNLKQRSLGQFVELNATIRQPALTMALRRHLRELAHEASPLSADDLRYQEPKATIEEWLG